MSEGKSTRALTGPRQLHKSYTALYMLREIIGGPFVFSELSYVRNSWRFIDPSATTLGVYVEDYFDTSGYTRDYLTTMPTQALFQEAGRWQFTDTPQGRMLVLDLLTTDRIDDPLVFVNNFRNRNTGLPSFPNSNNEWSQVIYGRFREYIGVTQATSVQDVFSNVSDQQFGSLGATTSDKIWIYRFIIIAGLVSDTAQIKAPAFRAVLDVDIVEEPTDAYMMRQKRSYELDNY